MGNFKLSITLVSTSYYMFFELEMESITINTLTPEKYVWYIYTFYFFKGTYLVHMRVWCTCEHIKLWPSIPHPTSHDNFTNNPSCSSPPVATYFYNNPLACHLLTTAAAPLLCAPGLCASMTRGYKQEIIRSKLVSMARNHSPYPSWIANRV
jgi:hypothetical protein